MQLAHQIGPALTVSLPNDSSAPNAFVRNAREACLFHKEFVFGQFSEGGFSIHDITCQAI